MPNTPLLAIPQVSPSQSQKEVTINDAILALESAGNAKLSVVFGLETNKVLSVASFTRNFLFVCEEAPGDATLRIPAEVNGVPTARMFSVRNITGHALTVRTTSVIESSARVVIPDGACRLLAITGDDNIIVAAEPATLVTFKELADVPNTYAGQAGKALCVTDDETGLEYLTLISTINQAGDVSAAPTATGQVLVWNQTAGKYQPQTLALGASNFLQLTDTPASYTGVAGKVVRVNGAGTGLEFADAELPTLVAYSKAAYWRVRALVGSQDRVAVGKVRLLNNDGFDLTALVAGTPIASSVFGDNGPENAFDDVALTGWISEPPLVANAWIGFQFAEAVEVVKVALTPLETFDAFTPTLFVLERSDDGLLWLSEGQRAATWAGDEQVFSVNGSPVQGVPANGTQGQVLSTDEDGEPVWIDAPTSLPPGGSVGQVLQKTGAGDGEAGWGAAGSGVPTGGNTGEVLKKKSATDGDVEWGAAPSALPNGGATGEVLRKLSATNGDAAWGPAPDSYPDIDGNAGRVLAVNDDETEVEWVDLPEGSGGASVYRVGFFFVAKPAASEVVMLHCFTDEVEFADNFAGAVARIGINPAATTIFNVQKNGSNIGIISVSTAGVATFSTTGAEVTFLPGDVMGVVAPSTADGTIASCAFTFKGTL